MGDAHVIEEDSIAKRSLKREPPKRRGADPEDLEDGLPPAKISRRTDDEVGSSSGRAGEDCEMISVEGDIGTASRSRRVALEGKASEKGEKVANLAGRSGGAERGARQRFSGGSGNKVADAGSEIRADGEERSSIRRGRGAEERAGRRGTVRGGDGRADGGADDVQECGETLAGPGEKTARAVADRLRISSTVGRAFACAICLDDIERGEQVCTLGCGHRLCFECAGTYVATKVTEGQVSREMLMCPIPKCKTPLAVHEVRGCLSGEEELLGRYERFGLQRYLESGGDNIFFCPGKTCEFAIDAGPPPERPEEFACPSCLFKACLKCKKAWHPKISCEKHAQTLGEEMGFLKFVTTKKMQKCPKCKIWVEKNEGCNAMLCRCMCTFCYRCGGDVDTQKGCLCLAGIADLPFVERLDVLLVNVQGSVRNPAHTQAAVVLAMFMAIMVGAFSVLVKRFLV